MDQLNIEKIVEPIDGSLGEELPFSARALTEMDIEVLRRVFGDVGYQDYLDDQANRQILRTYLSNAVVLGYLPESGIDTYSQHVETSEGRAVLSLHILMNSVEDAANLPLEPEPESLKTLRPEPGSTPQLKIIRN